MKIIFKTSILKKYVFNKISNITLDKNCNNISLTTIIFCLATTASIVRITFFKHLFL